MREIVFDTETTGFSFADGDRMVEIGCLEMVNRVETGRTFHAYFHPERAMPPEAQRVHGLSDAFLADKPLFPHLVDDLLDFIGDSPLVAARSAWSASPHSIWIWILCPKRRWSMMSYMPRSKRRYWRQRGRAIWGRSMGWTC